MKFTGFHLTGAAVGVGLILLAITLLGIEVQSIGERVKTLNRNTSDIHNYVGPLAEDFARLNKTVIALSKTVESLSQTVTSLHDAIHPLAKAAEANFGMLLEQASGLISDIRATNRLVQCALDKSKAGPEAGAAVDLADVTASLNRVLVSLHTAIENAHVAKIREEIVGLVSEVRETNRQALRLVNSPAAGADAPNLPDAVARLNQTLRRTEQFISTREPEIERILANLVRASANLEKLTEAARKYPAQMILGGAPPQPESTK